MSDSGPSKSPPSRNYQTFSRRMDGDGEALISQIRASIQKLSGQVRDIDAWAKRMTSGEDGESTREHFNELANSANLLAKETNRHMQQLVVLGNSDRNLRMQRDRLSDEFLQILNALQSAQRLAERAQKEGMKRVRYTQEQEEEEAMRRSEAASFDANRHAQLTQSRQASVHELKERAGALQELERDIADVTTIFADLARIVHEQGEMVDSIEENVESAHIRVGEGATQLQQAVHYKSKAMQKKIMLLVFLLILLTIIGLTIYFYIK